MTADPRHRLYGPGAVVWATLAAAGLALIAARAVWAVIARWAWAGLDDPAAWTVPPRAGGGL